MFQVGDSPTLLIFGQDFEGFYILDTFNGVYTEQVKRFRIYDNGHDLSFAPEPFLPLVRDPNFRRRDLNTVPVVRRIHNKVTPAFVSFSGVFTPSFGIWTVPVEISKNGVPSMADPLNPNTFKQGMNNYACANLGLFSKKSRESFTIFFGGISFEYFSNGYLFSDGDLPFVNQVTAIKIDEEGKFTQYILNGNYPVILSTQSNPGNQLLFGASADLISVDNLPKYSNDVIKLDCIKNHRTLVGYIVGGIQSTLPNTNTTSDSAASPYIFKVWLVPRKCG